MIIFLRYSSLKPSGSDRRHHHEAVGNFFENQLKRSQNLINTLAIEGNPFLFPDLANLVNYSVLSNKICQNVLDRDKIGIELVKSFREERMMENSSTPFWSTLPRQDLQLFSDTEIKVSNTQSIVTSMKKEKQLYARMLAISRTRPELCPDKVIGDFEFTNIPPSNFLPDGSMITAKSNEKLLTLIQQMPKSLTDIHEPSNEQDLVMIIDAWDLINDIRQIKSIKKVSDLTNTFLSELTTISHKASEIRLIFPPFVESSLHESVDRKKCSSKIPAIHFHVVNNTPIKDFGKFFNTSTQEKS